MAVPKGKVSKSKRNMRRAQYRNRFRSPSLSKCSRCGESKLPHRVCIHCGYYNNKEVIKMDTI